MRKNLATTVATILSALTFIIIGSCFSAFYYQKEIIKVNDPKVITQGEVGVFSKEGDKAAQSLELSTLKLGLKPATGEEDSETNIPSTVHEKQGSEGQFAKFKLFAPNGAKIYVTNIKIESKEAADKIKEERQHIMVSIKEINKSTVSLKEDKVLLGSALASEERQELTLYVWLSGKTDDILKASTISFDILFESL